MTEMRPLLCAIEECDEDARLIYYGLSLCMECWESWLIHSRGRDMPRTTETIERYITIRLAEYRAEQTGLVGRTR